MKTANIPANAKPLEKPNEYGIYPDGRKSMLRKQWEEITGITDPNVKTQVLIDKINGNDEYLKTRLRHALTEMENCLTLPGLTEIKNRYPELHNNQAFIAAGKLCQQNITDLKI